jgi:hypothetical protein
MNMDWVLRAMERYTGYFPRGPLREAMAHREEVAPAMLQILREATDDVQRLLDEGDDMAHVYAMYLLSYWRETAAYPLLVEFFSTPGEIALDVTGDLVTEDLGRMLASVCGGDLAPMKRLAENEEANEFVRDAALSGMLTLVACGLAPREEIVAYFGSLFRTTPRQPDVFWDHLVANATDLYPEELMAEIDRAYEEGLLEEDVIDQEFVGKYLALGKDDVLAKLRADHHHTLMEDPIRELGRGYNVASPEDEQGRVVKVGRNDRCPCGSGRKYKQCCGARGGR